MNNYVIGFCFNTSLSQIVLIKKTKPDWQKDRFNGVGGKIEEGEEPINAMIREFREETGAEIKDWIHFAELAIIPPELEHGALPGSFIDCFVSISDVEIKTITEEIVNRYNIDVASNLLTVPNTKWLIPMALDVLTNPDTFESARIIYRE